jgi:hypothetical protein
MTYRSRLFGIDWLDQVIDEKVAGKKRWMN